MVKYEKEFALSNTPVGLVEEDSTDVAFYSDEESFDALDYENAYLAFDPEISNLEIISFLWCIEKYLKAYHHGMDWVLNR